MPQAAATPCDEDDSSSCEESTDNITNKCVDGFSNMENLLASQMCVAPACLLTNAGFLAFSSGHITSIQLETAGILPVSAISLTNLINVAYVTQISEYYFLSALGTQALLIRHISILLLRELQIFPLPAAALKYDFLVQAGLIGKSCALTSLGLAYIQANFCSEKALTLLYCPSSDNSTEKMQQYINNGYVHHSFAMITIHTLVSLHTKYVGVQNLIDDGLFPFKWPNASQITDVSNPNRQAYIQRIIKYMVQLGYLQRGSLYLTYAAFRAIQVGYFNTQHFKTLGLWPCRNPSLNNFIAAGYTTQNGHLTALGNLFLRAQYFLEPLLVEFGIFHPQNTALLLHALFNQATKNNINFSFRGNPRSSLTFDPEKFKEVSDRIAKQRTQCISMAVLVSQWFFSRFKS
jgi:hypothetical protein